jgi:hypothetical protein
MTLDERIRAGFEARDKRIDELEKEIFGLKTALIGAGFLTENGLALHTSFRIKKDESKDTSENTDTAPF